MVLVPVLMNTEGDEVRQSKRKAIFLCTFSLTGGVCEPEGDRLILNVAHVAYRHLAGVISKVFGSEVLQLQHLRLTLKDEKNTKQTSKTQCAT